MLFGIINVTQQTMTLETHADLHKAQQRAGITNVDHGRVGPPGLGIGIVVYEYGMFVPPAQQRYFSIGSQLYAGNAVLYGFDERGESIDLPVKPFVTFMPNASMVERNIELGLIDRPIMKVDGEIIWQWPAERPRGV